MTRDKAREGSIITSVLAQLLAIGEDLALLELAHKVLEILLRAVVLFAREILRRQQRAAKGDHKREMSEYTV